MRGLNLLKIPLSSGGFVLFRLSLTFFRLKGKRDSDSEGAEDESSAVFHSQELHSGDFSLIWKQSFFGCFGHIIF